MLLAIDTATFRASIALHDGEQIVGECTWEAVNRHTVTLMPRIEALMESAGLRAADLTAIAVCIGPGSYTGVRIGVAVAQGLALSRGLPLVGLPTLDILAAAQPPDDRPLYAIFSAGRRRIGYARYRWSEGWRAESEVELGTWAEFIAALEPPALVVGELSSEGREQLRAVEGIEVPPPARHLRRAGYLADLGWTALRAGAESRPAMVKPRYLR